MRYRTVICVLFVLLLGCGLSRDARQPPPTSDVALTPAISPTPRDEPEPTDVPVEQRTGNPVAVQTEPDTTDAVQDAESTVIQSEPDALDSESTVFEVQVPEAPVQTVSPLMAMSRSNSVYGPSTFEERALRSDLVVRARLQSKTASYRQTYDQEPQYKVYFPFVEFTFEVLEVLYGNAGSSVVVELSVSEPFSSLPGGGSGLTQTAAESEQRARDWLSSKYYDSQWEDRDATLFLIEVENASRYYMTGRAKTVGYAFVGHNRKEASANAGNDGFSISSDQNKVWLPATTTSAGASTFYLESPDVDNASTESLSTLKSSVTTATSEVDRSIEGHRDCLVAKKRDERGVRPAGYGYTNEVDLASGLPAGTVVVERVGSSNTYWYFHLYGNAAAYFTSSVTDADSDPLNGYDASTKLARPLPTGEYVVEEARQLEVMVPCSYIPDERGQWTSNVSGPEGTLHELFFDPVTVGNTVAADSTNGVLKPASFTDANGASATIESISYDSGTVRVEVKVTPIDALAGQIVDFIDLDGTVSLSLDVADATVDSANDTLSWSVSSQPWHDGDLLMVRIREAFE